MADPVSLLGTVPALVALPAVCLQAIQTIQGFYSSLKHALSDVAQLLEELEAMRALTLRCLALPAADVPGDELQRKEIPFGAEGDIDRLVQQSAVVGLARLSVAHALIPV